MIRRRAVVSGLWLLLTVSSAMGQRAALVSINRDATDLVNGDGNAKQDAFVRDRQTGTTTLVSLSHTGTGGAFLFV